MQNPGWAFLKNILHKETPAHLVYEYGWQGFFFLIRTSTFRYFLYCIGEGLVTNDYEFDVAARFFSSSAPLL